MGDKGFKAFFKGMVCKNKQYEEETVYHENGSEICRAGMMHYCKDPQDVFNHYPILDIEGDPIEFANVEAMGEVITKGNKSATNVLRIGKKIPFREYIFTCISAIHESIQKEDACTLSDRGSKFSNLRSHAQCSVIETTGVGSRIEMRGPDSTASARGSCNTILAQSSYGKVFADGYRADVVGMADGTEICTTGAETTINLHGSGRAYAFGKLTQMVAASNNVVMRSDGDDSMVCGIGFANCVAVGGQHSIGAALGENSYAKGALGCWLVLAEYYYDKYGFRHVKCIRAAQIDGDKLKPDTIYCLKDGEFVELKI